LRDVFRDAGIGSLLDFNQGVPLTVPPAGSSPARRAGPPAERAGTWTLP
jgi:hypothetical protein